MKKVLLVVDLQQEFADTDKSCYHKVLSYINQADYDKIIATVFVKGNSNYIRRLHWDFGNKSSNLEFKADIIFKKTGYGLSEEQYQMLDKSYHYDIVGCETDACVLKIAMDLFDREYDFSVLRDYVYTNSDLQGAAISILNRNIGFM